MMEEEVQYVAVTFKPKDVSTKNESVKDYEVIYDELKTEKSQNATTVNSYSVCPCVKAAVMCLVLLCFMLSSAVIALVLQLNRVSSEQLIASQTQTEEKDNLRTRLSHLHTLTSDLRSDLDWLNWTLSVIMTYDTFPVSDLCPHKVCRPCLDGWLLFESSCYYFSDGWKNWDTSRENCRYKNADLVTIESPEEQEFINNHTPQFYYDAGYWIGLRQRDLEWTWTDGSQLNVSYWLKDEPLYPGPCARALHLSDTLSTWTKVGCNQGNHWICETPALVKQQWGLQDTS